MTDLTGDTLTLHDVTAEDLRVLLYVCSRADSLDDARELIDALGLNGRPMNSSGAWKWPSQGDVCRNGHRGPPRYKNGSCVLCTRDRNAARTNGRKAARA